MRTCLRLLTGLFLVLHHLSDLVTCQLIEPERLADVLSLEVLLDTDDSIASRCKSACAAISSALPNAVFVGQVGNYDFWDAKQRELIPACRVEPGEAHDIAQILQIAKEHSCRFAVKSGGHERSPGASNAEGGITIDLVRLKSLEIGEDKTHVTIGAGWRWGELYEALEQEGLMVLGGRIADVGVGGLLSGGGISFFSNERGLACDSIISYELILPNATIIEIDQYTQPRLFQSLRGSPPMNFGIISKFTLEAFQHEHQLWTGSKLVAWDNLPALLTANHHVTTVAMQEDSHISMMMIFMCYPRHGLCYGTVSAHHTRHKSTSTWPQSLSVYDDLPDVPGTSTAHLASVSNITASLEGTPTNVRHRTIYATFTYIPSIALEVELMAIFREEALSSAMKEILGFGTGAVMHPFSSNMLESTRKRGGNSFSSSLFGKPWNQTQLRDRTITSTGPLTVLNIVWQWDSSSDDDIVYTSYRQVMSRFEEAAKRMGLWHPYKYVNYAEAEQHVWEGITGFDADASAGVGNSNDEHDLTEAQLRLQKLKELQKELDPDSVFTEGRLAGGVWHLNRGDRAQQEVKKGDGADLTWNKDEL